MAHLPGIFTDFHNADPRGRARLNCAGTEDDPSRQQVALRDGPRLVVCSDDMASTITPAGPAHSAEEAGAAHARLAE